MTYQPNQSINDKFAVINLQTKKTASGDPYLNLELSNSNGSVTGRVWAESVSQVSMESGRVYHLVGKVDFFQNEPMINIKSASLVTDEFDLFIKPTPTMVFDIETVGKDFDTLDQSDQEYFLNRLEQNFQGDEYHLKTRTGLYPMFGSILTIGLLDHHQNKGKVLYVSDNQTLYSINNFESKSFNSELEMIAYFWQEASKFDRFVTYNGTGFDFPFLVYRSAVHRIKIPFETTGSQDKFIDLAYKFRMNNRPFKLEVICKSLGIENPKLPGVSGMEVSHLYNTGQLEEIVRYVSRDVKATSELYELWRKYLSGKIVF